MNLVNYLLTSAVLFLVKLHPREKKEKTLLLIRLDAIGDYILFRNFIKTIKDAPRFKNYHLTLCGNDAWKSLAEVFDKETVDNFIWIERKKFYNNYLFKYNILKKIYKYGFETAVQATHAREILYGDVIVSAARASVSIGNKGSGEKHAVWKRKFFTDRLYSELIVLPDNLFEFYVNKNFMENLLGYKLNTGSPEINISVLKESCKLKNKYVLLFPGAGDQNRMWAGRNFREISLFILNNFPIIIALSGSTQQSYLFNEIISPEFEQKYINFFGCSLPELVRLISESELLISNDTSAVHIAAAVNTPFVCISNGSYLGRFHPYPKEIFDKGYYIYPPEIMNNMRQTESFKKKYRFGSDLDINDIKPQDVIKVIKEILRSS